MHLVKLILSVVVVISLFSCSQDLKNIQATTQRVAQKWNADFQLMQTSLEELKKTTEDLFANRKNDTLDVSNMDAPKGPFKFLNNVFYYKEKDEDNAVVAATGAVPVDNDLRKDILLLEKAKPALIAIKQKSPATNISWIITTKSIGIGYPAFDFLSSIPQKLDLSQTFWFKMANPELDPEKKTVWSKEPFAAMTGQGWYKTVAAPIYDKEKFVGIVSSDALIKEVIKSELKDSPDLLFVVTNDSLLIGATAKAQAVLGLKVLEDYDYLKQLRENAFAPDIFKLLYEKNSPEIIELGAKLKTLNDFTHKIKNTNYHFVTAEVPVGGFKVVGMIAQ